MKPHVKLAKNEQVWHGVSSFYFLFLSFLLATSSCRFFLFFFSCFLFLLLVEILC